MSQQTHMAKPHKPSRARQQSRGSRTSGREQAVLVESYTTSAQGSETLRRAAGPPQASGASLHLYEAPRAPEARWMTLFGIAVKLVLEMVPTAPVGLTSRKAASTGTTEMRQNVMRLHQRFPKRGHLGALPQTEVA